MGDAVEEGIIQVWYREGENRNTSRGSCRNVTENGKKKAGKHRGKNKQRGKDKERQNYILTWNTGRQVGIFLSFSLYIVFDTRRMCFSRARTEKTRLSRAFWLEFIDRNKSDWL